MKIAVNTRLLLPDRLDGIGRFADESLQLIVRQHPEHEFFFLFDRDWDARYVYSPNVVPVKAWLPTRRPVVINAWMDWVIPRHLSRIKPDLFLSPDGILPSRGVDRSVAVIHDLNFVHHPVDLPSSYRHYFLKHFPVFARKASRVATVSEYSKADLISNYSLDPGKVDVVYNGAGPQFVPSSEAIQAATRNRFSAGKPYFLFVGTLHPRKNLPNLFRAFDLFSRRGQSDIQLLIAGARMWWTEEIESAYREMEFRHRVIFTGRVSDAELVQLTGSALALTYVSYFEGFGIPIIEAFACNTPVISSNVTSLPEVYGEAALPVDPFSPESIANAMGRLAGDASLRNEMIEKGKLQRQKFTWQGTAGRLWDCCLKSLE